LEKVKPSETHLTARKEVVKMKQDRKPEKHREVSKDEFTLLRWFVSCNLNTNDEKKKLNAVIDDTPL
jgi:hypothetical protein